MLEELRDRMAAKELGDLEKYECQFIEAIDRKILVAKDFGLDDLVVMMTKTMAEKRVSLDQKKAVLAKLIDEAMHEAERLAALVVARGVYTHNANCSCVYETVEMAEHVQRFLDKTGWFDIEYFVPEGQAKNRRDSHRGLCVRLRDKKNRARA